MSISLFPCGTVSSSSTGSIGSLAEPNGGCDRKVIHTTLVSKTDSNFQVTRKKATAYHVFSYKYENIWAREYSQIEQFFNNRDGKLSSFYLVDFSHMQKCEMAGTTTRTITKSGTVTLNTSYFTTVVGDGGNYACVWNPTAATFMIGLVLTISTNTNLTFLEATAFGDLAATTSGIVVCPVYEVFFVEDQLQFEPGEFNPDETNDGGFIYSGNIGFLQKGTG